MYRKENQLLNIEKEEERKGARKRERRSRKGKGVKEKKGCRLVSLPHRLMGKKMNLVKGKGRGKYSEKKMKIGKK